jgi:hypothetical protein
LPVLKLNEVRDFTIFTYDELQDQLKSLSLGRSMLLAWTPVFYNLDRMEEWLELLKQQAKHTSVIDSSIDLYICFYQNFSIHLKKKIRERVLHIKNLKQQETFLHYIKGNH